MLYFETPRTDNERLLNMQYEYKAGDYNALNRMYELGYTVALKYINAAAKKNKYVRMLSGEEKEGKAHNAISYIIMRFLQVAGFEIKKSFTAYIYLRVKHELFYRRKVDGIVQFMPYEEVLRGGE